MTVRSWLRSRTPVSPAVLIGRVEETLGERCEADVGSTGDACLSAADSLLRDLLTRSSAGRDSALDLLTVDALVTYAFEAASTGKNGAAIEVAQLGTAAMRRLSATVHGCGSPAAGTIPS